MRPIVYIIVFLIAALVFKAFFLDAYLAERKAAEANVTETEVTAVETQQDSFSKPVPSLQTKGVYTGEYNRSSAPEKPKPSYSEMPLEKVGDAIADKVEGKL